LDKHEYNSKLDQIKTLLAEGKNDEAAEVADSVNWNKVKNVNALVRAGEAYEKVGRYADSREILLNAYDRSPIGRTIIYRLAEVAIKMQDYEGAKEYYDEFVDIAPHDNQRYILMYHIKKAQGASYLELIPILEEFKDQEYTEEWACELAYLYHKAGMIDKCVDACDELILWFGDGPYVERALELKMLYQPLTKTQEEKYRLFRQEKEGKTIINSDVMERAGEYAHDAVAIPQVTLNPSRFNTSNLQEEIARGMQQILEATEKETVVGTMDNIKKIVEEIPYLQLPTEEELAEKEAAFHIETDEEIDGSLRINFQELLGEESDGQISLVMKEKAQLEQQVTGQMTIEDVLEEWEKTRRAAEAALQEAEQRKLESAKARALQEAEDIMVRLNDVIPKLESVYEETPVVNNTAQAGQMIQNMNSILDKEISRLNQENEEIDHTLHQMLGQEILLAQQPTTQMPEINSAFKDDVLLHIQNPVFVEEEQILPEMQQPVFETEEQILPEMQQPVFETEEQILLEIQQPVFETEEEILPEIQQRVFETEEEILPEIQQPVFETEEEILPEIQQPVFETEEEILPEIQQPVFETEEEILPEIQQPVFETEEEILPEIQQPVSETEEVLPEVQESIFEREKAFVKKKPSFLDEPEDLLADEHIEKSVVIKKLSEEQKAIFSYFVPVKGMESQLCKALEGLIDHLQDVPSSSSGNLIIQGCQGCGKTVLATSIVKVLQKECGRPNGRIGKIDAEALNKKDVQQLLRKVAGGCLIIERAGALERATAVALSLLLEQEKSGTFVILEDTAAGIKKALATDDGFAKKFTETVTVPIFTNDELVVFANAYANELGYVIDEMAILALHNCISNIEKLDQATTLVEVKEIIDDAIEREANGGIRKAFNILTAKRYTDDDKIVLTEKDFE